MADEIPLLLAGEPVTLAGARALYWPARQALLIADLHLGKADVFRRAGIALPSGGTSEDLQRLQGLLDRHACRELWILGDILHGPAHRAAWYQQWLGWRERNTALDVHVLRGNHDRQLPHAQLQVQIPRMCGWRRSCCAMNRAQTRRGTWSQATCIRRSHCPHCAGASRPSGCASG